MPAQAEHHDLEDFMAVVNTELAKGEHRAVDQRTGQWLFNRLHDERPDVANTLRGNVNCDPFYNDTRIPAFWNKVADLW